MPIIRTYKPEDREAVVDVWRRAGLIRPPNDPYEDIDLKLAEDPEGILVAIKDDKVVGVVMAGYEGHRGWIQYLGVDPDHQKSGIGRALVEAAVKHLQQRGAPKINLQVRRTNRQVVEFYEKLGFVQDDVLSMGLRLIHNDPKE